MTGESPTPDDLADRLRRGVVERLAPEELDGVLAWIGRGRQSGDVALDAHLGVPDADPALLLRVYLQLDRFLFHEGCLLENVAGVSPAFSSALRRTRYRRLLAAFHPDRHPGLADWLTPRVQAVQRAYAAFRGESSMASQVADETPAVPGNAPRAHLETIPSVGQVWGPAAYGRPGALEWLRQRLGPVRNLESKIVATLLVAVLLPTLVLYLNRADVYVYAQEQASPSIVETVETVETGGAGPEASLPVVREAEATEAQRIQALRLEEAEPNRVETVTRRDAPNRTVALEEPAPDPAGDLSLSAGEPAAPTESQVLALLEDYRVAFERGDLVEFLHLFSPDLREGDQQEQAGFEGGYKHLFAQSMGRELRLFLPEAIRNAEGGWDVSGTFNLSVALASGVVFRSAGPVHYRVQERPEGLRISAIEY